MYETVLILGRPVAELCGHLLGVARKRSMTSIKKPVLLV